MLNYGITPPVCLPGLHAEERCAGLPLAMDSWHPDFRGNWAGRFIIFPTADKGYPATSPNIHPVVQTMADGLFTGNVMQGWY